MFGGVRFNNALALADTDGAEYDLRPCTDNSKSCDPLLSENADDDDNSSSFADSLKKGT